MWDEYVILSRENIEINRYLPLLDNKAINLDITKLNKKII